MSAMSCPQPEEPSCVAEVEQYLDKARVPIVCNKAQLALSGKKKKGDASRSAAAKGKVKKGKHAKKTKAKIRFLKLKGHKKYKESAASSADVAAIVAVAGPPAAAVAVVPDAVPFERCAHEF